MVENENTAVSAAPEDSDELLRIDHLSVVYRKDEADVYAVNDVSIHLNRGEMMGLVGETGAGKTTTALSIMKLLPKNVGEITSGKIELNGVDVTEATEADMRLFRGNVVSMIFQDPMSSLNPVMSIGNQIRESLELHNVKGLSNEELDARVDELLYMVGIPPNRKSEYPHQFSGGMKQRVVIAIALACEPQLILADEPTTALDVTIQAQVLQLISELNERLNTAMILITHDLGIVAQTCSRVAVMYAGEIVESGSVEDIFESESHHPYTVGLFGAIPDMSSDSKRLHPIDGLMPDPTVEIPGCRFCDRCPDATDICSEVNPDLMEVEEGHLIKCHKYSLKAEG